MTLTTLSVGTLTHIGQVRSRNEDFMGLRASTEDSAPSLFVVADGMGGHSAGDVASKLAVETTISQFFDATIPEDAERLRLAVVSANRRIFDTAQANAECFRMGTTLVSAAVRGAQAEIANVGDSRLYMVRGGVIHQVTRDHSWVALQIELGEITPEEAQHSINRSVLLRCLGEKASVLVDMVRVSLRVGDVMILCTDGLHGLVTPDEIRDAVSSADPQPACDALVALANSRGGNDNITVQIIRVDACPAPPENAGDDLVVERLTHSDLLDDSDADEIPVPAVPPSPPAAPMFHKRDPIVPLPPAPSALEGGGASEGVPWALLALAALAGAVCMKLVDRLVLEPVPTSPPAIASGAPLPAGPSPLSLASPSLTGETEVMSALSSPLPSSGRGGETAAPGTASSAAVDEPGGSPSSDPSAMASSPSALASREDRRIAHSTQHIGSPGLFDGSVYWLSDGRLQSAAGKMALRVELKSLPPISALSCAPNALFVARAEPSLEQGGYAVGRLQAGRLGRARIDAVGNATAKVRLLASNDRLVAWQVEKSDEIVVLPLAGKERRIQTGPEDLMALLAPPGSDTVIYADQSRIYRDKQVIAKDVGRVHFLAADADHLYWVDAGELEATVHRCAFDGTAQEEVARLTGTVVGFNVGSDEMLWVISEPKGFTLWARRLR